MGSTQCRLTRSAQSKVLLSAILFGNKKDFFILNIGSSNQKHKILNNKKFFFKKVIIKNKKYYASAI